MTDQASECILNRVLVEHTVHRFALKMVFSYLSDSEKRAVATDLSYASGPALQELFLSLAADHEIGIEVTSLSHGSDELHERALALGDECMIAAFPPETPAPQINPQAAALDRVVTHRHNPPNLHTEGVTASFRAVAYLCGLLVRFTGTAAVLAGFLAPASPEWVGSWCGDAQVRWPGDDSQEPRTPSAS